MEKIYVFQKGQCQTIQSLQEIDEYEVSSKFQMKEQFNVLMQMVMNLGNTVNLNAKYLQNLQQQTSKNFEQMANTSLNAMSKYSPIDFNFNEYSLEQKLNLINQLQGKMFNQLREENEKFDEKISKNEKDIEELQCLQDKVFNLEIFKKENIQKVENMEEQIKGLAIKSQVNSELQRIEGLIKLQIEKTSDLDQKVSEIEFTVKRNEKQSSQTQLEQKQMLQNQKSMEGFEEEFSELKNTWLTKLQNLEQKMQENAIVFNGLDQFQNQSKKKFDQIYQELEVIKLSPQEPKEPQQSQEKSKKVVIQEQVPGLGKNINALEYQVNELTDRLNELEGTTRKKILSIENKVREFDDLKKLSKLVSRLQIELNSKVSQDNYDVDLAQKIDKDEFFDYINKNLVYKDKIETFRYELQQFQNDIENRLSQNNNDYSYVTDEFSKRWKDIADKINLLNTKLKRGQDGEQQNSQIIATLKTHLSQMKKLFDDLKLQFDEQINHRLNSLGTTHQIRCLSCGEKDLNYPPMHQYTYGDDQRIYLFENNDVKVVEKENFSQTRTRPTTASNFRIQSGKYDKGESVFSKKHVVQEHQAKNHQQKSTQLLFKKQVRKERPMTSIPKQKNFLSQIIFYLYFSIFFSKP